MNRKKEPLSTEESKLKFTRGVWLHQADKGICLVSGAGDGQWWADFSNLIGEENLSAEPNFRKPNALHRWKHECKTLQKKICKVVFNIESHEIITFS